MATEPEMKIGKIVNHTHVLDIGEIRQIVTERVLAEIGEGIVERVEPVHVAPADDSKLLTKAARAWRGASGEELEFQETSGTKRFWFGIRYTIKDPSGPSGDDELPDRWPPEGQELEEADEATVGDQLEDGFGEIREE